MPQHDNKPSAVQPDWEDFRKGDRDAFERLYHQHIQQLIAYGMRITGEQQVVKDVIQDLFVELWRSRAHLQSVHSVRGYLLKALRYKLLRNTKIRTRYYAELPDQPDPDNAEQHILETETEQQRKERIRLALERLPGRQQEVINLRFYHGCSTEEAAEIMAVNYQSAVNLLHRAIVQLREMLGPGLICTLFFLS
ncbi:RNA polymerase sigma factor [Chitinophaga sp. GCM10012297]|uniref:RNA polymerase sigma factor n=1 Tax=Chitinophaga chungangae TaxID=2821488 RepID=A0ABS3YHJ6_9BACT|nr:RNA polymerase sigma factor [Chitinophaga chungangae]MBO9153758.1 RNA polymerase sigma factor [Chitinophaga chungangae]